MTSANFLAEHNAKHLWHPMSHPEESERNPPRIIASGRGVFVTDLQGQEVIDAVGGLWNANLGYSCGAIKAAIREQLEVLPYASAFHGLSNPPAIELSEKLSRILQPEDMTRFFFTSGGSDSVEVALKLARQYWKIRGESGRYKFLSLKKSYHGTHFGSASVNGNDRFRRFYEPLLPGCYHVPYPWTYRNPFGETDEARLSQICLELIREEIRFQGPETIAAFILEPVLGAGGVFVPPEGFVKGVRDLCERYKILFIADEVITGFGRTGEWFGSRLWGIKPDLMCFAKAISSAYFPFGAVAASGPVAEVFQSSAEAVGTMFTGYTYSAHPVGCAAALAALDETFRLDLAANARRVGAHLKSGLEQLAQASPLIGEVRGVGLMLGLECVKDKRSKAHASPDMMEALSDAAYRAGALIRTAGNVVLLSPPLVLTEAEADLILAAVSQAFRSVEATSAQP